MQEAQKPYKRQAQKQLQLEVGRLLLRMDMKIAKKFRLIWLS